MITTHPNFTALLTPDNASEFLARLNGLAEEKHNSTQSATINNHLIPHLKLKCPDKSYLSSNEKVATDWLIVIFNALFVDKNVQLVRGKHEPEYVPADNNHPARIEFAHGFFASALHETSHWCIAGNERRQLSDFGYWYAPDGRTADQQQAFERVEIKPQALECLFTLACGRSFQVSQDNLFADFDTSNSTFNEDVYQQVISYTSAPQTLPPDAKTLLIVLLTLCTIR